MRSLIFIFLSLVLAGTYSKAQIPFDIYVEPHTVTGMPGVHSYAFARLGKKIVITGGRKDGLHRRQPNVSFLSGENNTDILLLNLENNSVITRSLSELSPELQEQLQSANMQSTQSGDYVFWTGGYGRSTIAGDHITYPRITAAHIPGLINAMETQTPIAPHFFTLVDQNMAVTGGQMRLLNDTMFLVGGNRFDGRYNPNNGPSFTQEYTNRIKKFHAAVSGGSIQISGYSEIIDNELFHRRDYNLVSTIFTGNEPGYTIASGVFQVQQNFPYETWVDIRENAHAVHPTFEQKLNHYHCAKTELFDSLSQTQFYLFFGGIARYHYNSLNVPVVNDSVPFVNTIGCVVRNANGDLTEFKMDEAMPGLLGAGAEFFNVEHPAFANGVIRYESLSDSVTLGYIVGGINSTAPNIFFVNTGSQSTANSVVYKVVLKKKPVLPNTLSETNESFFVSVQPNPSAGIFQVLVKNLYSDGATIKVLNLEGKQVHSAWLPKAGEAYWSYELNLSDKAAGIYFANIRQGEKTKTIKIIKE
jgi:hypothetical protein